MNAQLLNPFTIDIPDSVSTTLSSAECSTLHFNHGASTLAGQYLAVGRTDGFITIWDIETRSVLRVLAGHVRAVTGLAWSAHNRYLASSSGDWNVIVWDLAAKSRAPVLARESSGVREAGPDARLPFASERRRTVRFDCAVVSVQFAPASSGMLVVVLASQEAYLVDVRDRVRLSKRSQGSVQVDDVECAPRRIALTSSAVPVDDGEGEPGDAATAAGITAARFSPDSRFVVAGTSKGSLLIFDATTGELLDEQKVLSTSSGVKELAFDAAGKLLVVNCNDRAIRIVAVSTTPTDESTTDADRPAKRPRASTPTLTLLHKIQDMIQRTAWTNVGFSPSADYIFAGAAHKASHNIYVWDRTSGTLSKILEGPKDWAVGVDWHPARPMLASASNTGAVYVWFTPTEEIWSAYAPGFEELEENMEYEEREDEFDFIDGKGEVDRRRQVEQEAAFVRVGDGAARRARRRGVQLADVEALLRLNGEEGGRERKALQMVVQRLDELCFDSGWKQARAGASGEKTDEMAVDGENDEERLLEYTLLDDDDSDAFVIPPRLETDYSEFYDDHM
ncbi:related to SWD1-subunit of the COMPASS complex [Sporisorium reilianum SRZ2]|uniref:Related to SWD1-subunit of the COMPASS complex n=1 Tax=Sporisorium reilianum (strain SRZ2) TaxID=999809 RepID=E6ZJR5_SPORE|nr:related to SWD1-subunit of the COMPASS complex [Sporisorium reilianum SRZ2]